MCLKIEKEASKKGLLCGLLTKIPPGMSGCSSLLPRHYDFEHYGIPLLLLSCCIISFGAVDVQKFIKELHRKNKML